MGNLFLSFTIAIGGAIGVVTLSRMFDLETYITRTLPIIPILYAIIYELLDRRKARKAGRTALPPAEGVKIVIPNIEAGISPGKIIFDVAVSFVVKFAAELFLVALFIRLSGRSFGEIYGSFNIETVSTFLRGEHPWLSDKEGIYLLALVAILSSFVTGVWIGNTSKGNAILEGVIAGAAVTLISSMTSMLVLYRTIEEMTVRLADSMGYVMNAGFLVVIGVQVLLYGLWSGLSQNAKRERKGKRSRK